MKRLVKVSQPSIGAKVFQALTLDPGFKTERPPGWKSNSIPDEGLRCFAAREDVFSIWCYLAKDTYIEAASPVEGRDRHPGERTAE